VTRRHKARRWALQILYAWEVRGRDRDLRDEAEDFFARRTIGPDTRGYAARLVGAIADRFGEIDALLAGGAEHWDPARMAIVDRNVLRIALAEFLAFDDVPSKVSIDEAVELAGRYGGADSPRFVNGVLDAIAHRLNLIPS
jgi:transcription antitermination protein NusB